MYFTLLLLKHDILYGCLMEFSEHDPLPTVSSPRWPLYEVSWWICRQCWNLNEADEKQVSSHIFPCAFCLDASFTETEIEKLYMRMPAGFLRHVQVLITL